MPNSTIIQPSGRKQKYLNNKDLLAEIHKSKASFSSYISKDYIQHDIILPSIDKINVVALIVALLKRIISGKKITKYESNLNNKL